MYRHSRLLIALITVPTLASVDCIDNSHYLQVAYDYKEYHDVEHCMCPCEKEYQLLHERGQCPKCLHYRVPREFIIISDVYTPSAKESSYYDVVPQVSLQKFITTYKNRLFPDIQSVTKKNRHCVYAGG